MPKKRRSLKDLRKPSRARSVIDQLLAEAEKDPEKFVSESLKLGKNVVASVRAIGKSANDRPDEVRRMARNEGVRLAALIIREALK